MKGVDYEIRIRKSGGLLFPEIDEGESVRGTIDEVRNDERNIFERTQINQIRSNDNVWKIENSSAGSTESSRRENGTADRTDEDSRERERRTESTRPDALGTENEQYPTTGGGERTEGDSLQLEKKVYK